jgi:ABC-type amino acid transport/signal transduction systems, periplasmic component/domain
MKKNMKQLTAVLLILTLSLTGCGTKAANSSASASKPEKLVIVGPSSFDTVSYVDKNGKLTGFEVELLRAIDKELPEYEFDFQPTNDLASIFLNIETKKADIGYCQIEYNKERAKKYLFTKESYCNFPLRITVLGSNNTIQKIEDLYGKKVQVNTGGNDAYVMEKYNKEHGNKIKLVYATPDATITDGNLKNGSIDAYISVERYVKINNKEFGFDQKCVGDLIADSKCYFITNLNNEKLSGKIDKAVAKLRKDGTISKLSKQFFGDDYSE